MDYFEEEEKKQMEALEEKKYQELYKKQAKSSKIVMLICLFPLGIIFVILGIILSLTSNKEEAVEGIAFLVLGIFFLILGILLYFIIPQKGDYKKYKKNLQRFGGMNLYTMSIQLGLLEERVKSLEKENEEIKRKINEKQQNSQRKLCNLHKKESRLAAKTTAGPRRNRDQRMY